MILSAQRPQDLAVEVATTISHGIRLAVAVLALPLLVLAARRHGSTTDVVAVSVFARTMILVYLVSTLSYAAPDGRLERVLDRVDHAAVHLFIAGTCTAFALRLLRGPGGWMSFGRVWALAAAGVAVKLLDRLRHPLWSTGLYVAMSWIVLFALAPLLREVPAAALRLLLAGGAANFRGAAGFLFDSTLRDTHFAWHLLSLAGSGCHLAAAMCPAAPGGGA